MWRPQPRTILIIGIILAILFILARVGRSW
jgi:preprotein translocase subunit Sec61beta